MNTAPVDEVTAQLRRALAVFGSAPEQANATLADAHGDDVYFEDPIQVERGRSAFLAMKQHLARRMRRIDIALHQVTQADDALFLVSTFRVQPKLGPPVAVEGVSACATVASSTTATTGTCSGASWRPSRWGAASTRPS